MKEEKDIRTLCANCAAEYEKAGYKLTWAGNKYRDKCDKCGRMGLDYVVEEIKKPH
jgi:hypothetical protein